MTTQKVSTGKNRCAVTIILLSLFSAGVGLGAASPSRALASEPGRETVTELLDAKGNIPYNPTPIRNGALAENVSGMSVDGEFLSAVGDDGLFPSLGAAFRGREFLLIHPGQFPPLEFEHARPLDSNLFLVQHSNFLKDAALFGEGEGKRKSQWRKKLKKLFGGSKNRAKKDRPEDGQFLFLQDVRSGSVNENLLEGGVVIHLEISPRTVFMRESPGVAAGTMTTEVFFSRFSEIFGQVPPNGILTLRGSGGTGTAVSVPITIRNPVYDTLTGMVDFIAIPLELTAGRNSSGTAVEVQSVEGLEFPFGLAFLFIDGGSLPPILPPIGPDEGTCGDGAGAICPVTGFEEVCLNKNATGPECCDLSQTSCDACGC